MCASRIYRIYRIYHRSPTYSILSRVFVTRGDQRSASSAQTDALSTPVSPDEPTDTRVGQTSSVGHLWRGCSCQTALAVPAEPAHGVNDARQDHAKQNPPGICQQRNEEDPVLKAEPRAEPVVLASQVGRREKGWEGLARQEAAKEKGRRQQQQRSGSGGRRRLGGHCRGRGRGARG